MEPVISAAQMRRAEECVFAAQPGVDLMGRAARAVVQAAAELSPSGRLLVAVGPGNNGGDGLFAAALLAPTHDVSVWLVSGRAHEPGLGAARQAGVTELDESDALTALPDTDLVIDAVLGIGGRPGLRPPADGFADACRALNVPVLAVDLPSGLDADSGDLAPSFHVTATITFAALKRCHVTSPARDRCGAVSVADIGVPIP